MTVRRAGGTLAAVLVLALLPGPPAADAEASRAPAATGDDCGDVSEARNDPRVEGENTPYLDLHVPEARELARGAGRGVTVVVVDSGIGPLAQGSVPTGHASAPGLESGHGLAVAGIIGGPDQRGPQVPVGIAPAARLVDAPFYDAPLGEGDEESARPMASSLAAALRAVASRLQSRALPARTVVVVPAQVRPSPALQEAVRRVVRAGALVVAPAGDRPGDEDEGSPYADYAGRPRPGEDAVRDVWPAGEEGVLSVGLSVPEARRLLLRNSGVDIAAPGAGSVTIARDGGWCVVTSFSTHWAVAQVAGVAALVWSRHADDSATAIRTRLVDTASGNGGPSSPVTGHGVVQPVEALQRRPEGIGVGMDRAEVVRRAQPPAEREDLLADTRRDAVWWGLAGGGAVVVLLVLRPVLARRRR